MLAHLAQASLRNASRIAPRVAPVAFKAVSARFATRFMSSTHFAVDSPDGNHDLQDIVSFVYCCIAYHMALSSSVAFVWCSANGIY